jgi:hypothetical protein
MTPSLVVVFSFLSFLSDFLESFLFCFLSSFESEVLFLDFKKLMPVADAIALKEDVGCEEDVDDPFEEDGLGLD